VNVKRVRGCFGWYVEEEEVRKGVCLVKREGCLVKYLKSKVLAAQHVTRRLRSEIE
jgi:hypothetical protein